VIAASPADGTSYLLVEAIAVTDADYEAIRRILASFRLTEPIG
jgi:hypothetical protein